MLRVPDSCEFLFPRAGHGSQIWVVTPHSLFSLIERCMRNFLWTGSISKKKLVTVPWNFTYLPVKEGGIGIKQLKILNEAMLSKMTWKLLTTQDYPILVFSTRFLYPSRLPRADFFHSFIWSSIRRIYCKIRSEIKWFIGGALYSQLLDWWFDFPISCGSA